MRGKTRRPPDTLACREGGTSCNFVGASKLEKTKERGKGEPRDFPKRRGKGSLKLKVRLLIKRAGTAGGTNSEKGGIMEGEAIASARRKVA